MNQMRAIDRLDTQPRFTDHDAIRLNRMFRGAETEEWLRAVIEGSLAGDSAIVSSFGAESAVLLHLVSQIDASIPVLFLDTGKHFPETLAYRDQLAETFGLNCQSAPRNRRSGTERRDGAALVIRSRWLLRIAQGKAAGKGAGWFRCQFHRAQGFSVKHAGEPAPV